MMTQPTIIALAVHHACQIIGENWRKQQRVLAFDAGSKAAAEKQKKDQAPH